MIKNVNLMQNPQDIIFDKNSEYSKEYLIQALANLGQRIGIKGDGISYKSFNFNDILLDDKLYSFIGYNNDTLYLATNTPNTDVLTYSFGGKSDVDVIDTVDDTLDVKEMSVPTEVIDEALSDDSSEEKNLHPVEFNNDKPNFDNSDFPDVPIEDVDDKEVVTLIVKVPITLISRVTKPALPKVGMRFIWDVVLTILISSGVLAPALLM